MSTDKPLSDRARRFAEVWAGDNTRAAEEAGYTGTRKALGVTGARLRRDPRVAAIIEARRVASAGSTAPPASVASSQAPEPGRVVDVDPSSPVEVLERLMTDETVHASSRVQAARILERRQRELHENTDPLAELRAKKNAILLEARKRERETGCCPTCWQPLPERNR